jgi:osmotically inducible lipoprotein OsmB
MSVRAKLALAVLAVSSLSLAACGETPGCRAVTGAGAGAAGGAAIGALAGAPLTGALAGAAGGGLLGAATSPDQVNGPSPCY